MTIYHYTNADTLPLILANRTIRFTRSDLVDDESEVPFRMTYLDQRNFFVSSWSLGTHGEAGMWARYADSDRGVRIALPSLKFPWAPLHIDLSREKACLNGDGKPKNVGLQVKHVVTPFGRDTAFGNGYVALPMAADMEATFGAAVMYSDNPEAEAKRRVTLTDDGFSIQGDATYIARVKGKGWADQAEYRFVIHATKGPQMDYVSDPDGYIEAMLNMIEAGAETQYAGFHPDARYIDVPLASNAFDEIVVTFGAAMSQEKRTELERSMRKIVPSAVFEECALSVRARP